MFAGPILYLMMIHMLVGEKTGVVAVFASAEAALAKMDQYNADPFLDGGAPDPDAPYRIESWTVSE